MTYESIRDKLSICLLGFMQGLPLIFLVAPLQLFMMHQGLDSQVGWSGLVLLPYSLKFIWSPYIDKFKSYGVEFYAMIAFCTLMVGIFFSLIGFSKSHTAFSLIALSMCIAFMSSTLDDIIDGFRSHVYKAAKQSFMISLNVISYRIGMLMGAVIIWASSEYGWQMTLQTLGPCYILLGFVTASLLPNKTGHISSSSIDWYAPIRQLTRNSILPAIGLFLYRSADFWIYGLLTVYLVQYLKWTAIDVANTLQVIGVISVISGNMLAHIIIKKLSLEKAKIIFLLCQFAAILLLSTTLWLTETKYVVMCIVAQELVYGFTSLAVSMICYQNLDKNFPTYSFAAFTSFATLPRFIISPLSAHIVTSQSWASYFLVGLTLSVITMIIITKQSLQARRNEPTRS